MKLFYGAFFSIVLSAPSFAGPSINVGSMYEYLDSDKSTLIKRIRNNGDATAFVKVEVSEIKFDSAGKSTETPQNINNVASGYIHGMVASPSRMIIPVKSMQTNRLMYVGPRDVERYYRVRFMPVTPKDNREFGQSEAEFKEYTKAINAGVTVLHGFGIIVTVRPATQRYSTEIQETGNQYIVRNNGNSTVIMENLIACNKNTKKCREPVRENIRPGKETRINKALDETYKYQLTEGSKTQPVNFGH